MAGAEETIADPGSFAPVSDDIQTTDPLSFPDYASLRSTARGKAGSDESVVAGPATIGKTEVELAVFEFGFLGGSMGEVAGERIARAMERAAERRVPFVLRTATGGARMQEGMRALIQMPKLVVARRALADAHVPLIAILGHPTTGGVLASIASLADITVAEAEATIGFAGPRVAERFTGEPVAGNSHSATSAFTHGLVDEIVAPADARAFVAECLRVLAPDDSSAPPEPALPDVERGSLDAWDAVTNARAAARPEGDELARGMLDGLVELKGDRAGRDDPALTALIGRLHGRRVLLLALNRSNAPGPGAFRKAKRCLRIAERLDVPVVTLVDTRGADPSSNSENSGIAWEISSLFETILGLEVPTVAVVTGEGGSGGALAFATTDVLLALQGSIFSVIGPEGAAEILWREGGRAPEAARLLKLTAHDLVDLGIADAVLPEPLEPGRLGEVLAYHLGVLSDRPRAELRNKRLERWRGRGKA